MQFCLLLLVASTVEALYVAKPSSDGTAVTWKQEHYTDPNDNAYDKEWHNEYSEPPRFAVLVFFWKVGRFSKSKKIFLEVLAN